MMQFADLSAVAATGWVATLKPRVLPTTTPCQWDGAGTRHALTPVPRPMNEIRKRYETFPRAGHAAPGCGSGRSWRGLVAEGHLQGDGQA